MGTPVFLFSEVVEATYLGDNKIRWREIGKIYPEDNETSTMITEFENVEDYYTPDSMLVVIKGTGSDVESDKAELQLTGGFNRGDLLQLDVAAASGALNTITVELETVADSAGAAAVLADAIRQVMVDSIHVESGQITGTGETSLFFWAQGTGDSVSISTPVVTRSTIVIPPEVEEFMSAVSVLED